jgi:hypothetical protein
MVAFAFCKLIPAYISVLIVTFAFFNTSCTLCAGERRAALLRNAKAALDLFASLSKQTCQLEFAQKNRVYCCIKSNLLRLHTMGQ